MIPTARSVPAAFILLMGILGARPAPGSACPDAAAAHGGEPPAAIAAALQASVEAWNRQDLEAFLAPYDASATFVGSSGLIGRAEMEAHYRRKYFVPGADPGRLRFEGIEARVLSGCLVLVTGRWAVERGGEVQAGWFSLTWFHTPAGWRIVHDHSS
jgi:ketosteroid isomerase-like protein